MPESLVNKLTNGPANTKKTTPTLTRKIMLYTPHSQTERSARSGRLAPRFCPTSVAAALLNHHAGSTEKITIRIAMV